MFSVQEDGFINLGADFLHNFFFFFIIISNEVEAYLGG